MIADTWYSSISILDPRITGIFVLLYSGWQIVNYSRASYTGQSLYKLWIILEILNCWIYIYQSYPHLPAPTAEELVSFTHRTPAEYTTQLMANVVIPHPPTFNILGRQYDGWDSVFSKCGV
ncbi:uncharacterized protein BO88DRAFT_427276 [Aspergillus vadensis CBS 113365]|uniref:Uncharacterized protein n=1 Tax=Aspergillus vadensis (strain CBS 113365 / IMI 142717 / IBT 24658) TaxID=1448311 RepID=A0A319B5E6_ASPVC|nr:hypothetical protein BO88DRAFT_427276 [Aspergillus vadensis CBS 113365]PYH67111.1 hypothetical protein BO88DRAFT_427276 [Aspergillus vadensis CBS 113365]